MNEKYSDLGTKRQMEMRNRILLGDERGSVKKTYVLSNLDVLFDNDFIDDFHRETGKIYWGWRTIARKKQGYAENPAYEEIIDDSETPAEHTETEDGAVWEMFTILTGLVPKRLMVAIDASCNEAHPDMPLYIIQAYIQTPGIFKHAFDELDKRMMEARRLFEKRCEDLKNNIDHTLERV